MYNSISGLNYFNPAYAQNTDTLYFNKIFNIWDVWQHNTAGVIGERRAQAVEIMKECVIQGGSILDLSELDLTEIPVLPAGIKELNVSRNALITLPEIPNGVKKIDASHNRLEQLCVMPSTLEELDLTNNMFRELPFIGHPLRKLDFSENPISHKIPKILHYIWLGDAPLPTFAVSNIINSAAENPDYEVKVWVENSAKTRTQLIDAGYSTALFSNVKFIEPNPPYTIQSIINREGDHTQFANYAAASDILRLYVLHAEGGVYLDVDVALKEPLGDVKSQLHDKGVQMSDFLILFELICNDKSIDAILGNAVLAAVKNSPSASELLFESISPYLAKNTCISLGSLNSTDFIADFSNDIMQAGLRLEQTNPHSRAFGSNVMGKEFNYDDIIWHLKKCNSLFRINLTKTLTGPNLIYRYFHSKGINYKLSRHTQADENDIYNSNLPMSAIAISNSAIFGKLNKTKQGFSWSKGIDAKGRWVYIENNKKEYSEI
ncbi:glycosyltransferase family 32 protein [Sodalis ligni]|uniref:Glycosyl transferase-like sugar-binding protein n=1 Tax=Sodalis ligni TaxID=2697027 RepID=A0A4R1N5Z3_9GAMM|nr:TcdA/TcdB catalytic glycosyltransferase domain-containing protein [Sodalis ligni]TCL02492.1 glycosyl transferase-like sugar-binding protein [Sodalis ligni]